MARILFIFILLFSSFQHCFGQVDFEDVASDFGIEYAYGGSAIGGGVSFCDFNNDGWDDISISTNQGDSLLFYINNGCSFVKLPSLVDNTDQVKQITWVDIDNDGDKDLFLTTLMQGLRLYENTGSLQFNNITVAAGIDTVRLLSHGANWADYDKDGDLDVYISTWIAMDTISNILYRNNGNKTFTDVTKSAGLFDTNSQSYAGVFFDFNKDGWPDIYSTTDKVTNPNRLYKNNGNGTFTDVSISSNTFYFIEGMCGTVDDYDNDGWLDIFVTNTYNGNLLLYNNGNSTFTDSAAGSGVAMNSWAWGAGFLDGDNDGDLDLYVSSQENGDLYISSVYYENSNGQFTTPSVAGMSGDTARSYGNAIGDFNNDGLPDIIVANRDEAPNLWNNNSTSGNYVKIILEGTISNRDGIGSFIYLYSNGAQQLRYTLCGESFLGQFSQYEIIGVGNATVIDSIVVEWLSGVKSVLKQIPVNQTIKIVEGSKIPQELSLAALGKIKPCEGDSILLQSLNQYNQYLWNTGDTTESIFVDTAGTYILSANNGGAISTVQIDVIFIPSSNLDLGSDTTICPGEILTLNAPNTLGCNTWSDASGDNMLNITSEGTYWLEVNQFGCISSDTIEVEVFEVPELFLGDDTIICVGDSLTLDAGMGWEDYYWSDNSTAQKLTVWQSGMYSVDVTDSNGCIVTDEIEIYVTICLSVEELAEKGEVNIYPNPADDLLKIEVNQYDEFILQIHLYDASAKQVLNLEFSNPRQIIEFDISELISGTYHLIVETNLDDYSRLLIVE